MTVAGIRDSLTGLVGAVLLIVEVLNNQPEPRVVVITLAIAMIGAPSALASKRQFQETPKPPEQFEGVSSGRHAR